MLRSLVLLLFICLFQLPRAAISDGFTYYPQARGFLKLHRDPEPWDLARIRCHDEGAALASPLHAGLLSTVKSLQAAEPGLPVLFSGVHSIFADGLYFSVDGVPLEKMPIPWAAGIDQSNLEKPERCLVFLPDGTMEDQSCHKALPYLCFAELSVCEPGGQNKILPTLVDYELDARTGSAYKFHTQAETWKQAFWVCQQEGGHLAIINSDHEAVVLKELFEKHPSQTITNTVFDSVIAVGFHSWKQTGSYWTIHGETLEQAGYSRWGDGQPSSAATAGGMFRDGTLDDFDESFRVPFICEKTPRWWPSYN